MHYRIVKQYDGAYGLVLVRDGLATEALACDVFHPQLTGFKTVAALKEELAGLQAALDQPILVRLSYADDHYREEVK